MRRNRGPTPSTDRVRSAVVAVLGVAATSTLVVGRLSPESTASVGLFWTLVVATFAGAAWLGYRRWNVVLVLLVGSAPFLGLGTGAVLLERVVPGGLPAVVGAVVGGSVLVGVWGYGLGVASRWLLTDRDPTVTDLGRLGVLLLGGSAVVAVACYVYWTNAQQGFPW